eukprot:4519716-Pyramimonas_sp.AAC.1
MVDLLEDMGDQTKGAKLDFECEPVDFMEFMGGDRTISGLDFLDEIYKVDNSSSDDGEQWEVAPQRARSEGCPQRVAK